MRRKMLITVVLIFAILLQCIMPLMTVNAATSVEIDTLSSELYAAIKSSLEEQGYTATYDDTAKTISISEDVLSQITYLDLSNSEIDDLTGLSSFTSVTKLNLTSNELTVDSNLSEIDSLPLVELNLSSNKLESVSSISTFDSIATTDITNQEVTKAEIITVDISEESEQATTATVTLPDILLADGALDADWFTTSALTDSSTQATIKWGSTNETSLTITVNIAEGTGDTYTALESGIKVSVDVTNTESNIAYTKMSLYYIVINSDQTGIVFYDNYLYNAVKEQLTADQTVNSELDSYHVTDDDLAAGAPAPTTLYDKAYDDALVLVIDNDVLINKISSLILYDQRITDLKGLEEFIGLESDLNVSYNYIDSIKRIIELEENKETKEAELQSEYAELVSSLSSYIASLETALEEYNTAKEAYEEAANAEKPVAETVAAALKEKETKASTVATYRTLVSKVLAKMYKTYEKEYLMSTVLTANTVTLSSSDINSASTDELKSYVDEICTRLATLEESEALTDWESNIITTVFGIATTTTVTNTDGSTEEVEIENPISAYCKALQESTASEVLFSTTECKSFLNTMRIVDTIITAGNYSVFESLFGGSSSESLASSFAYLYTDLTSLGYTTEFISQAQSYVTSYDFTTPTYSDADAIKQVIGTKYATITSDLIAVFVKLPRLKSLNLTDNSIESLDGIEALSELETLKAYKNLLDDVSEVKWSELADTLTYLDLGYNQLSNIDCLEVLSNLEYLYVNKNLLSGSFDFTVTGMSNLKVANFSENQISDISGFVNQFKFKAKAVDMDVEDYILSSYCPTVSFQSQTLSMDLTVTLDGSFITVDLPDLYEQAESIDYSRTSFGIDSLSGTVASDGTTAKLYTPSTGSYSAVVTIEGDNGSGTYSTSGIAYGTTCTIKYTVVEATVASDVEVTLSADVSELAAGEKATLTYNYSGNSVDLSTDTVTWAVSGNSSTDTTISSGSIVSSTTTTSSEYQQVVYLTVGSDETAETITVTAGFDADSETTKTLTFTINSSDSGDGDDNTGSEDNPGSTDSGSTTVEVTYGYTVSDGYVYVASPEISLSTFANNLVTESSETVTVTVTNSDDALDGYLGTGGVVSIDTASGEEVAILEIVVLGDVNGDGEVDALDSGIVRAVINDTKELVGVYYSAADVNKDGDIDSLDALLILQYRADKITSF